MAVILPCSECGGRCCVLPVFSPEELQVVRLSVGVPPDTKVVEMLGGAAVVANPDGVCPYLHERKCSIYAIRPKVCRDYGAVPDLPCEYLYPQRAMQKQLERIKRCRL